MYLSVELRLFAGQDLSFFLLRIVYFEKGVVRVKKVYESPILEKVYSISDDEVCGLFDSLFGVDVASSGQTFTQDSIFEWEQFEKSNN